MAAEQRLLLLARLPPPHRALELDVRASDLVATVKALIETKCGLPRAHCALWRPASAAGALDDDLPLSSYALHEEEAPVLLVGLRGEPPPDASPSRVVSALVAIVRLQSAGRAAAARRRVRREAMARRLCGVMARVEARAAERLQRGWRARVRGAAAEREREARERREAEAREEERARERREAEEREEERARERREAEEREEERARERREAEARERAEKEKEEKERREAAAAAAAAARAEHERAQAASKSTLERKRREAAAVAAEVRALVRGTLGAVMAAAEAHDREAAEAARRAADVSREAERMVERATAAAALAAETAALAAKADAACAEAARAVSLAAASKAEAEEAMARAARAEEWAARMARELEATRAAEGAGALYTPPRRLDEPAAHAHSSGELSALDEACVLSPPEAVQTVGIVHKETGFRSFGNWRFVTWRPRFVYITPYSLCYQHLNLRLTRLKGQPTEIPFAVMRRIGVPAEDRCVLVMECIDRQYIFRFRKPEPCEKWAATLCASSSADLNFDMPEGSWGQIVRTSIGSSSTPTRTGSSHYYTPGNG
ncbi:hypothetical protein AB1Y20_013088 [Prymnesium parvum]|uniref:Ubiquitin-like domain-containing protein n=1 Tax=Prymnesium parvum TaxID=97485 RepID=A0AB34IMM2_PRYPA